jgi:hypothetical protein
MRYDSGVVRQVKREETNAVIAIFAPPAAANQLHVHQPNLGNSTSTKWSILSWQSRAPLRFPLLEHIS